MIGRIVINGRLYGVLETRRCNTAIAPSEITLFPRNAILAAGVRREVWLVAASARTLDDATSPIIPEIEGVEIMDLAVADALGFVPSLATRAIFTGAVQELRTTGANEGKGEV